MKRNKKKAIVMAVLLYLLLTTGLWMFLRSYANSYNKLTTEKISPASLTLKNETVEMKILEETYEFSIESITPESRLYYILYMTAPDEVKLYVVLISLLD
ncbi:MAG: hypothetical protein LUG26_09510 [Ruminococcus sp.]|nr:hypothetical protein [Ruminococcus sp.]